MVVHLYKLKSGPKKFKAEFFDDKTKKRVKSVSFGAAGMSDYNTHFIHIDNFIYKMCVITLYSKCVLNYHKLK